MAYELLPFDRQNWNLHNIHQKCQASYQDTVIEVLWDATVNRPVLSIQDQQWYVGQAQDANVITLRNCFESGGYRDKFFHLDFIDARREPHIDNLLDTFVNEVQVCQLSIFNIR